MNSWCFYESCKFSIRVIIQLSHGQNTYNFFSHYWKMSKSFRPHYMNCINRSFFFGDIVCTFFVTILDINVTLGSRFLGIILKVISLSVMIPTRSSLFLESQTSRAPHLFFLAWLRQRHMLKICVQ